MPATCPRCRKEHCCQPENVSGCACHQVQLSDATREFLEETYYDDYLCHECLTELNRKIAAISGQSFPTEPDQFIAGIHYYLDDGKWVFTERYHLLRGYCCNNRCRHCAYGFVKNP